MNKDKPKDKPYNELPLLPPNINLDDSAILKKAISANRSLGELKGIVHSIPNQGLLINGIVLQEARLSSEIENIVTTNDALYKAEADERLANDPQSKEVLRYREALWHGFNALKEKPLSTNLLIDLVSIIKNKKMDVRKIPGTRIGNTIGETIYTPPEGESVIRDKLSNLEKFIHAEDQIDPLVKLAIMHYQFEAIHPFSDGNGRTGRIMNILFLIEKGLLERPVLFLSHYILKTKSSYYKLLREVTEQNNWTGWIQYILEAIEITARETRQRVVNILESMEKTQHKIQSSAPKIYSKDLIELIYEHPYSKVKFLEERGIAKRQTAATYLKALEDMGLLKAMQIGKERYYINLELIKILSK